MLMLYTGYGNEGKTNLENSNFKGCTLVWVPWEEDIEEIIQIQWVYFEEDFIKYWCEEKVKQGTKYNQAGYVTC